MYRILLFLALTTLVKDSRAFVLQNSPRVAQGSSSTQLAGLGQVVGRFRKKKAVGVKSLIKVGNPLPQVDVEVVTPPSASGEDVQSNPADIAEVVGQGTSLLVGMPGAYTSTCTKEHMPDLVAAVPKLKKLGVDTIAVVTTNDRFVVSKWAEEMNVFGKEGESHITMISDGDGELSRELGLADDM